MRWWIVLVLTLIPLAVPDFAFCANKAVHHEGTFISAIELDGFVLGDKGRFEKLFKAYRNKYLTQTDMDELLQKVQAIYEREGYQQLVTITYQVVKKHRLVFTALMIT